MVTPRRTDTSRCLVRLDLNFANSASKRVDLLDVGIDMSGLRSRKLIAVSDARRNRAIFGLLEDGGATP
jgi:hypothetical protein